MLQSAMARIDRSKLSLDEVQIHYDVAVKILYNLDWNSRGLAGIEDKLQMIASSTIGPTKESHGMSSDNKGFLKYMAKETYWWHLTEAAKSILAPLAAGLEQLPEEDAYFRRQRQLHFKHAFSNLEKDMRNANPVEKQLGLPHAARRLAYKYQNCTTHVFSFSTSMQCH
ncbi:hypothetical protein O6H91_Y156400 [Diphasiastrum complanatum]|nr:hypothetical protein O6H91_Y156400 [Diphasiastrum complanatum]